MSALFLSRQKFSPAFLSHIVTSTGSVVASVEDHSHSPQRRIAMAKIKRDQLHSLIDALGMELRIAKTTIPGIRDGLPMARTPHALQR
jgi:hypothetical protein